MTDNYEEALEKINALLDEIRADPEPIESAVFVDFAETCLEKITGLLCQRSQLREACRAVALAFDVGDMQHATLNGRGYEAMAQLRAALGLTDAPSDAKISSDQT
mgnify:CR=1 FL=1